MASPIIHRCQHCGYESEISSALSVYAEDPFCRQCGLSASESDSKMQDELSMLIDQQLNLNQPATQQVNPPITYITQHYHHSAHVVPTTNAQQDDSVHQLASHGIDTSVLSPSQIRLFTNALPEQQSRLIELWQIAPPKLSDRNVGNWPQTSLEQEEELARQRFLKMTSPFTLSNNQEPSREYHQTVLPPDSPTESRNYHAEPYMINGYAAASDNDPTNNVRSEDNRIIDYNRARDPVYLQHDQDQSKEWWKHDQADYQQSMEHQYGAFSQMRSFYGHGQQQEDEEML